MTNLLKLFNFVKQTTALGQINGFLGWDQETMMSRGSIEQRAQWMGHLSATLHERKIDPRIGEWLDTIDSENLTEVEISQIRHISRDYNRALKIPIDFASSLAIATSKSQGVWAEARSKDDFSVFLPILEEVLNLKRQEARLLSSTTLYDSLLNDFEPEMNSQDLESIFKRMRPRLISIREKALISDEVPKVIGRFPKKLQLQLSRKLALAFGYDFDRGRLDLAVHPFSSGSGNDVRITTRVSENDPFNCLYSTIHEVGHATYEQNINKDFLFTPLGSGVSMGVHESQSRIYENQIGRSRAFTKFLYGEMLSLFGDFGIKNADDFYKSVNGIRNGFIRTEADEVQYNLHIMLRFELEKALINDDLRAEDLESAWNEAFLRDFGYPVDNASNGVLQDVHWSVGLFGYFPTYSLGNIYAGCLNKAMRADLPDLDHAFEHGNVNDATDWLKENVQKYGGLRKPEATISHAIGGQPDEEPLLQYLEEKFGDINS